MKILEIGDKVSFYYSHKEDDNFILKDISIQNKGGSYELYFTLWNVKTGDVPDIPYFMFMEQFKNGDFYREDDKDFIYSLKKMEREKAAKEEIEKSNQRMADPNSCDFCDRTNNIRIRQWNFYCSITKKNMTKYNKMCNECNTEHCGI